ncbi:MAG: RrF2 family transcriptional regulator [Candidatus Dormibacteria bacterium]
MDLSLTKKGDYVVCAALYLARKWDEVQKHRESGSEKVMREYATLDEISLEMDLPRSYTPQIMGLIVRARLAEAKAGRDGGYKLVRKPSEITLLEVVEAGEGQLRTKGCTLRGGPCRWEDVCALHEAWSAATRAVRGSLQGITLEEVALVDEAIEEGAYSVPSDHHRNIHS